MNIVDLVARMNQRNKNVNITCVGLPGSGKSYGFIRLLMRVTGIEDKSILKNVFFDGNEYIKRLKKDTDEFESLLLDDAGFTFSSREWWKDKNIDFVKEIQVARKGKKNIFVSTPHPRLVDAGLGPITHLLITLDFWKSGIEGSGTVMRHMIKSGDKGVKEFWKESGKLKFETLDEKIAKAYERKKNKELRLTGVNDLRLRDKILTKLIDYQFTKSSYREIARMTGTTANTISKLHKMKDVF